MALARVGGLLALMPAFEGCETFFFCYDADTTRRLDRAYRVPNMPRNPIEFVRNLFRAARIMRIERPRLIVSTGAEIAIPVALAGKAFGVRLIHV